MRTLASILFLCLFFAPGILAQSPDSSAGKKSENANKQLATVPYEIRISSSVAEKLLIHKVEPVWVHHGMEARFTGTVVIDIEISNTGSVLQAQVVSGPAMLRKPVLDAVRKYKYKPYLLNGQAVEVETTVSITMTND